MDKDFDEYNKEERAYFIARVRYELERQKAAKKKTRAIARRSFCSWMQNTVSKVGRALGYRIHISLRKCGEMYDWLFEDEPKNTTT